MPFIVRCPNSPCQKYNLVEDDRRGQTVACLVCGTVMRVDAEKTDAGTAYDQASDSAVQAPVVRTCPQCQAKLRVPVAAKSQRIKCPKCQTVFGR